MIVLFEIIDAYKNEMARSIIYQFVNVDDVMTAGPLIQTSRISTLVYCHSRVKHNFLNIITYLHTILIYLL